MGNPKAKKRRKKIIFGLIALGMMALVLTAAFKKKDAVVAVQAEKAARRNLTELVKASGKIQPVLQVKISPEVSGEIVALPVKEGQNVKKGDLLVTIRPDNYEATRDQQRANYRYALANSNTSAANLEKALSDFQQNEALYKNKLISDADFQAAKTSLNVAKASLAASSEQVSVALATLHNAESDLSKTVIFSPIDGKITKLNSQLGERVVGTAMMAGTDIMTVSDLNEMEARVNIGEVDVVHIAVGQKVNLDVDAFQDRKFHGLVTDIANSAMNNDTSSSTTAAAATTSTDATKFQVKIRIQEREEFLPGMSVSAEIETRYRTNVVTVPIQCVTMRLPKPLTNGAAGSTNAAGGALVSSNSAGGSDSSRAVDAPKQVEVVFVMEGDHVRAVPVKHGIEDDYYYEITDGLKDGEMVVTGSSKAIGKELDDGVKVTTGPAKSEPLAAK